jgi:hypothetical protein
MRTAIRTLLVATAGVGCAAACTIPSPRVGLRPLGSADTKRPIQITANRSVAVAFTATRAGQLDAVNLVVSRHGGGAVGLLAYLVTPNDPGRGTPSAPVAAAEGTEPGCWGSVTDSVVAAYPRVVTIRGYACPVQAGHTYWIQFATVLGGVDLYPSQGASIVTLASRSAQGLAWERVAVTGGLEATPVTH